MNQKRKIGKRIAAWYIVLLMVASKYEPSPFLRMVTHPPFEPF